MGHTFANGDNDRQWIGARARLTSNDTEPTKRHKYCASILINNNDDGAESEKKIEFFVERLKFRRPIKRTPWQAMLQNYGPSPSIY